jgi:hypothetical protein
LIFNIDTNHQNIKKDSFQTIQKRNRITTRFKQTLKRTNTTKYNTKQNKKHYKQLLTAYNTKSFVIIEIHKTTFKHYTSKFKQCLNSGFSAARGFYAIYKSLLDDTSGLIITIWVRFALYNLVLSYVCILFEQSVKCFSPSS